MVIHNQEVDQLIESLFLTDIHNEMRFKMCRAKYLVLLVFWCSFVSINYAEFVVWNGSAGDGKYENPKNWSNGKVPCEEDVIDIPKNSPDCLLPNATIRVKEIWIGGTLTAGNTSIQTSYISNHGVLNAENSSLFSITNLGGDKPTSLTVSNWGQMYFSYATVYIGSNGQDPGTINFENAADGMMLTKNFITSVDNIENEGHIWAVNQLSLTSRQSITNTRTIGTNTQQTYGGELTINTPLLTNAGELLSGGENTIIGGDINIYAEVIRIKSTSTISTLNAQPSGNITLNAVTIDHEGAINTHYSLSKTITINNIHPGNIELIADTINMHGNNMGVWAKNLIIRGKIISIANEIHQYFIEAQENMSFYTTPDGSLDLSGVVPEYSFAADSIIIFSNNIIAPAGGLESIFELAPNILPADTNFTDLEVWTSVTTFSSDKVDTIIVYIRNTSTTPKAFTYNASSKLNWFNFISGVTNSINPFMTDSFFIPLNLPTDLTETTTDTISIEISIAGEVIKTLKDSITIMKFASGEIPVELSTFTASADNGKIKLNWTTVTEKNNYGFEVERKNTPLLFPSREEKERNDRGVWEKIGFVKGKGTTTELSEYNFYDDSPLEKGIYRFRLKQIDMDGSFTYSEEVEVKFSVNTFSLEQNYPNPFNPLTTIKYALPVRSIVRLEIFNVLGEKIAKLVDEVKDAGIQETEWDANGFSSGIYFYRIHTRPVESDKEYSAVNKMIVIK